MGPIQSSLNTLTGAAWGAIASASVVGKKFAKPKAEQPANNPKAETTNSMGNNVKIGRVPRNRYAKAASLLAANNSIGEKAPSVFFSVSDRIAEANFALNQEGGKK